MNIKQALLSLNPVVTLSRKHDTGQRLLTMPQWLIDSLRTPNLVSRERASETRYLKGKVQAWRVANPDEWKECKAFYNEKAKEYRGEQRASMRKLDVRAVRRWKSGNLTVSLTRDASDQRTLQAWK